MKEVFIEGQSLFAKGGDNGYGKNRMKGDEVAMSDGEQRGYTRCAKI